MIDHVTIQVDDIERSRAFYEGVLEPLGIAALAVDGDAIGFFGPGSGGFWLCPGGGTETRELHVAFTATSRSQVREFHCAAIKLGAEVLHGPQVFDQYDPDYFAAFVRDPDGHNIEVVCRLTDG